MKRVLLLILCFVMLLSLSAGVLAAEEKLDPANEIQQKIDEGITKGKELATDLVKTEVEKQVKSVEARVEQEVKDKLPQTGSKVIYIVLAILAIGVVFSILKKLIKLAAIIVVLGLLIMWAKPMLQQLLGNLGF